MVSGANGSGVSLSSNSGQSSVSLRKFTFISLNQLILLRRQFKDSLSLLVSEVLMPIAVPLARKTCVQEVVVKKARYSLEWAQLLLSRKCNITISAAEVRPLQCRNLKAQVASRSQPRTLELAKL